MVERRDLQAAKKLDIRELSAQDFCDQIQ